MRFLFLNNLNVLMQFNLQKILKNQKILSISKFIKIGLKAHFKRIIEKF